jgi:hypothetical protein
MSAAFDRGRGRGVLSDEEGFHISSFFVCLRKDFIFHPFLSV